MASAGTWLGLGLGLGLGLAATWHRQAPAEEGACGVAAWVTHGCSLKHVRLQPGLPGVRLGVHGVVGWVHEGLQPPRGVGGRLLLGVGEACHEEGRQHAASLLLRHEAEAQQLAW